MLNTTVSDTVVNDKLYHVVVIRNNNGKKVYMTDTPVTHKEGCTLLSKLTKYSWRTEKLEEVV